MRFSFQRNLASIPRTTLLLLAISPLLPIASTGRHIPTINQFFTFHSTCKIPPRVDHLDLLSLPTCPSTFLHTELRVTCRTVPLEESPAISVLYRSQSQSLPQSANSSGVYEEEIASHAHLFGSFNAACSRQSVFFWPLVDVAPSSDGPQHFHFERLDIYTPIPSGPRTKLLTILYNLPLFPTNRNRRNTAPGRDYLITHSATTNRLSAWPLQTNADGKILTGDNASSAGELTLEGAWSALCSWKSPMTGLQYLYIFGKRKGRVYQVRRMQLTSEEINFIEVQTFTIPIIDPKTCTITPSGTAFFAGGKVPAPGIIYTFTASDTTEAPVITIASGTPPLSGSSSTARGRAEGKILALEIYHSKLSGHEYLLVGTSTDIDVLAIEHGDLVNCGTGEGILARMEMPQNMKLIGGISVLQHQPHRESSAPVIAYAAEEAGEGDTETTKFFAVSPLPTEIFADKSEPTFQFRPINLEAHPLLTCPHLSNCSHLGFCPSLTSESTISCSCFARHIGPTCSTPVCPCHSAYHGSCHPTNPTQCICNFGLTGTSCTIISLPGADYKTIHPPSKHQRGYDGDDPAIWIHPDPRRRNESRVIVTVKSEKGKGFGVYTLRGELVQEVTAEKPNNVDVVYGIEIVSGKEGGKKRKADFVVAGCRGDRTICIFEINSTNGTLHRHPIGHHPLPKNFHPYGSCVYQPPHDPTHTSIFITSKTSQVLQYRLSSTLPPDPTNHKQLIPTLTTTLMRSFYAGTGGQIEGCVVDEKSGRLFIGEERYGIWAYPADAEASTEGETERYLVDRLIDLGGNLTPDVEGLAIIPGSPRTGDGDGGYLIASCQGTSSYAVYNLPKPHQYLFTFSIAASAPSQDREYIDQVTHTDGIAAVGVDLRAWEDREEVSDDRKKRFGSHGVLVVHDDVNEGYDAPGGGAAGDVGFKIVDVERLFEYAEEVLGGVEERKKEDEMVRGVDGGGKGRGWLKRGVGREWVLRN